MQRAEAGLAARSQGGSFLGGMWGFDPVPTGDGAACHMPVGKHLANRVGHVQGGVLCGLAAGTAAAALGEGYRLFELSARFLSPGSGPFLDAQAHVMHRGKRLAVTRVTIEDAAKQPVVEVSTCHTV